MGKTNWGWGLMLRRATFSASKIKEQILHVTRHILEGVQNNPYLGLQISDDLKWKTHINNIIKNASSTLGFLRWNLRHCPQECKRTAYISLVGSVIEYGAIIWNPYTKLEIDKIERNQRQSARFITGDYRSKEEEWVTNMLQHLELPPLKQRRETKRLIVM